MMKTMSFYHNSNGINFLEMFVASRKKAPAPAPELDKVEKAIWKFLLKEGGLKDDHGYYGGMWMDRSSKSYKKAMEAISTVSIDWTKTKPVKDDYTNTFAGTFAENPDTQYYIEGTVHLKDGNEYTFVYRDWGISDGLSENMRKIFTNIDLYMELMKDE